MDTALANQEGEFIQSLERGLAVVRAFDADHQRLTISEAAQRSGMTRAGARRVLHTLKALGYARDDGKHFSLTAKVLELGYAYLSSQGLSDVARVYMEEVVSECGESCALGVLDGAEVVYIARVQTPHLMTLSMGVGVRLPASTTAVGRVLLAGLTAAELDTALDASPLDPSGQRSAVQQVPLLQAIEAARLFGYSIVDEDIELGLRSIAVPIHDRANRVVAALVVITFSGRTSLQVMKEHILPLLRRAARLTEQAIGYL